MRQLFFSPAALRDIEDIWDYTAEKWGLKQAEHYTDTIQSRCVQIAQAHVTYIPVRERDGYFKSPTGAHFIYFRIKEDDIEIMRVLHKRMDTGSHL